MKDQDEDIILKYVILSQMKGIGPATQNALIGLSGGVKRLFEMEEKDIISISREKQAGASKVLSFLSQRHDHGIEGYAKSIIKAAKNAGIDIVTKEDEAYPNRIRNIGDMPALLYKIGELKLNCISTSAGIVGARRCSEKGKLAAIKIATDIVKNGGVVISGMAKGIDSYAHTAALKAHGYTIAILGNGADICYPKEHERLYESIKKNGCIVTEYPPKVSPREFYFPRRNRLIAGFSDGIYVIDANRKSGTRSTVEFGRKYDRKIMSFGFGAE